MATSPRKKSEDAQKRPRDASGQFIKEGSDPVKASKAELKISDPISVITHGPDSLDEPLVSFTLNNPFKKLLAWLNDIKRRQTTTFDLKIKVPLIALPVFLAVIGSSFQLFFNLGKQNEQRNQSLQPTPTPIVIMQPTATPAPVLVSKLGIIKATYQVANLVNAVLDSTDESPTPYNSPGIPTPTPIPPSRYVLLVRSTEIIFLITPPNLSLQSYINKRVIITGLYDTDNNTLNIGKSADIEIIP